MKKVLVIVLCVLIFVCSSCNPSGPSPKEEIDTVRKEIGARLSHCWEQNYDSLLIITQSMLRSGYTYVKFDKTAVICYNGALKSELSLEDIDVGVGEYYSLSMPFFDTISLNKAYQWAAGIDTIWFSDTFIRIENQGLSIQGNLVYGEGVANELRDSELDYYIDIVADNWIIFYNYQEHYLDSTSLPRDFWQLHWALISRSVTGDMYMIAKRNCTLSGAGTAQLFQ